MFLVEITWPFVVTQKMGEIWVIEYLQFGHLKSREKLLSMKFVDGHFSVFDLKKNWKKEAHNVLNLLHEWEIACVWLHCASLPIEHLTQIKI